MDSNERVARMLFAKVYPLYVEKVEKKGRSEAELREIISWLTGFDGAQLDAQIASETSFAEFFAAADMPPESSLITGVICGVRVQEIEDPLMQKVRYLDKIVDELAKGKAVEKIIRTA
ncbi:DUF2200 domain-containing protein [Microbacterium halophytorum]|uniref:DUF2200 domain-containing protein n=1 Tax=Microbacterium halophytorum TaxID=2067568 RepID=UPI000CFD4882|nr:DUF2200 domain-containing protein [Microbacterium halophytorum]